MWAVRKQSRLGALGPAHLVLLTSEEIDTLWKRGSWPRDKNRCSAKLETGRTAGPIPLWKPRTPTALLYARSQQKGRSAR
ncbi:hypothetical protein EYF80_061621 [Liparis tanakae]|uniref:Uncharacterized protein n=1 Tax=Liparis tanakae TaxID=230148 RepID=A0A4Z2EHY1_9TELE|nr:hypothetical protein EYF80_061621 [Liparis tanakae]